MRSTVAAWARLFALIAVICLQGVCAMAAEGLMTLRSNYGPKDTMDRLEAEVKAKGLTVFAMWTMRRAQRESDCLCGRRTC